MKTKTAPPHGTVSPYLTKQPNKIKIALFDIEVAPSLGWVWQKWETNVIEFDKEWYMLSFSYKWLGGKTRVVALPDFPRYKKDPEDDTEVVRKLWELFNEADILIAHNGKAFDVRKANSRFIQLGLTPPSPYKVIDTLLLARRFFKFSSNKLDDLSKDLGLGSKVETGGYSLWRDCMRGDLRAWNLMKKYNKQDTELLERVYLRLLPWSKESTTHKSEVCTKCNSVNLIRRGYHVLTGMRYQRLQCKSCGSWTRERKGTKLDRPLVSI